MSKYLKSKLAISGRKAFNYLWSKFWWFHEGGEESEDKFTELCESCGDQILENVYRLACQSADKMSAAGFSDDQIKVLGDFREKYNATKDKHLLISEAVEFATCIFEIDC